MNWYEEKGVIYLREQNFIIEHQPKLKFIYKKGIIYLKGIFHLNHQVINFPPLTGDFELEFEFPDDYPNSQPKVKDVNEDIPHKKIFHVNKGGGLCLETPIIEMKLFNKNKSLQGFIDNLLAPFIYGFVHKMDYGYYPIGEWDHGVEGLLKSYEEFYSVKEPTMIIRILDNVMKKGFRPNNKCPCGCGIKQSICHYEFLSDLSMLPKKEIEKEKLLIMQVAKGKSE